MTLYAEWEQRRREVERARDEGRMHPDEAARELAHLDYRLKRRPLILRRRRDRNAWRKAQRMKRRGDV